METEKIYTLLYVPTGLKYRLTKTECDNYILEDKENFKVLEKDYIPPSEDDISDVESVVLGIEQPRKVIQQETNNTNIIDMLINKGA